MWLCRNYRPVCFHVVCIRTLVVLYCVLWLRCICLAFWVRLITWRAIIDNLWVHAAKFKAFKLCLHNRLVCVFWEVPDFLSYMPVNSRLLPVNKVAVMLMQCYCKLSCVVCVCVKIIGMGFISTKSRGGFHRPCRCDRNLKAGRNVNPCAHLNYCYSLSS